MKKVLVTGATGFIGNYVVKELLARGLKVTASSSNREKASMHAWFEKVNYIPFDLAAIDTGINYFDFFNSPDLMIHLAWEGLPNYTSEFHLKENVPRHLSLLSNLISNGLKDITVTGTCFEYGMTEGCLTENMECKPVNAYALAKNELRKSLHVLSEETSINFKWARLFYMYGKGQNPKSLISQLDKAIAEHEPFFNMSGGEQVRDFLPVEKVAQYIVEIALQQQVTGIINCCSGYPVRLKDFVEAYLEEKNSSIKLNLGYYDYPAYEPMKFWGDIEKLNLLYHNE